MLKEILKEIDSLNKNQLISGYKFDKKEYHIINKDLDKKETSFLYDILKKYGIKYQERKAENFFVIEFDYRKLELNKIYNFLNSQTEFKNIYIKLTNNNLKIINTEPEFSQVILNYVKKYNELNPSEGFNIGKSINRLTNKINYYTIKKM